MRHIVIFILLTPLILLGLVPLHAAKNDAGDINQTRPPINKTQLAPLDLNDPAIKSMVQNIKKSAQTGDANAQYSLGALYYTGQLIDKDKSQARKWFKKAADQGEPTAQYYLGQIYLNGDGINKNKMTAIEWLKKSAKQGEKKAEIKLTKLGVKFVKKQTPRKKLKNKINKKRKPIAATRNPGSGSGSCSGSGSGSGSNPNSNNRPDTSKTAQNKNLKQAEEYMLRGLQYRKGDGVPKDSTKSFMWIKKAADLGLPSAQFILGGYYLKGEGVAKDRGKGVELFMQAAENGSVEAGQIMMKLTIYIDPEQQGRDGKLSFKAYKKIVLNGDKDNQYMVGQIYLNGWGIDKSGRQAASWFKRAATQGHADAALSLSILYYEGNGVKEDGDEGLKWLNKAAELGSEKAKKVIKEIKSGQST